MAISKKIKKILEGFYAATRKYEEAFENGNRPAALKYGRELFIYVSKHREVLGLSDENISENEQVLIKLERSLSQLEVLETKAAILKQKLEMSAQDFQAQLKESPKGKNRTQH